MNSSLTGLSVTHRRYVKYGDAHYGGNLVDGAYVLGLFGDVATEVCIRTDADEGLFASYSDVQFRAPVLAGDIIEATATVTAVGLAQQAARVRGTGGLPGRSVARGFRRLGAQRAYRRRHTRLAPSWCQSPFSKREYHVTIFMFEGGGGHAAL